MFYNILEQTNTIMMEFAKIVKNNISLDILRQHIFPDRPEEASHVWLQKLVNLELNFSSVSDRTFQIEKQLCVFLRNKYGFQIGNAMEKNKLYFDQEEIGHAMEKINSVLILSQQWEALSPSCSLNTLCRWLTVGDGTLCLGFTTDGTTLSCRKVGHSWSSCLQNLRFVNICPQWCRQCQQCRWLQQGDWYSIAEGFQLC